MVILRTEKIIRALCRIKLTEKRNSQELMDLLGLEETLDRLAEMNEKQ